MINLSINSEDPSFNTLNIWNNDKANDASLADSNLLYSNTMNAVRSIAYRCISEKFWKDEKYALEHLDIVDNAINDTHPVVNMAAIDLLFPLLNYDNHYSLNKFIELCNRDHRMACRYGSHHFFNNGFNSPYKEQFINLVLAMLNSSLKDIRKEAAHQIYTRWFFQNLFEDQIDNVLYGDDILRKGCASVVRQLLTQDKYFELILKIEAAYLILLNDDNEEVRKKVAGAIHYDNYWVKPNTLKLFNIFVTSKAANYFLYELFHTLESHVGNLSNYSQMLLDLIINLTTKSSENKINDGLRLSDSAFVSVIQRLYDEATENEDNTIINICLDIWDLLLQSEISFALNIVNKIDRGLLN